MLTPDAPTPTGALTRRQVSVAAALAGVVTAMVTLAVAEVASLLLSGMGNPLLAVGSLIVDLVPAGFKSFIIELFDTADKLVLFLSLGIVVFVFAIAVGLLQLRRPPWGYVALGVVGLVAVIAAVTRAEATALSAVPTLAGVAAGIFVLRILLRRLEAWRAAVPRFRSIDAATGRQVERRTFLLMTIATGVASAVVGVGARVMSAASAAVTEVRDALKLPAASSAGPEIAADATLDAPGISSFITPNAEFYRIDTALQVPSIDPAEWSLRITGMVDEEIEIGFDELLALPLQERLVTLSCVSNTVGGDLIGNAMWLGYPIRELLARARPQAGADMVLSTSIDGFTASTPLDVLQDDATNALLAVGMNGEPLPLEHGFPVRMVVPGLYGYVSATKWVVEMKVTTFEADLAYWSTRGWTERGPIKISSRIDTPTNNSRLDAGTIVIGGVAWSPHIGIAAVDVRIDGGAWRSAALARTVTVDSWLQWSYAWDAGAGDHQIEVRATDTEGLVQTSDYAPPAPDGSTGWHTITVGVG